MASPGGGVTIAGGGTTV